MRNKSLIIGHILKDEETLESHKIQAGDAIHLVVKKKVIGNIFINFLGIEQKVEEKKVAEQPTGTQGVNPPGPAPVAPGDPTNVDPVAQQAFDLVKIVKKFLFIACKQSSNNYE